MVKQVERKDDRGLPQNVQGSQNQVTSEQIQQSQNRANISRKPVSATSIPSQLYHRLGLTMPRWLFWILTVFVGFTLSGLLVSSLALWTPLWSTIDRTEDELGIGDKDTDKTPLPEDVWSNISQYHLTRPMNILILGIKPNRSTVDGSPQSFAGNSGTMLLARLNPKENTIRVLSIPKDTMVAIPGATKGLTKLSGANSQGGPVLAARVVSRTLTNAPIDRYIRISTDGLRQLIDHLGGVEVFVPKPIVENGEPGGSSINLVSGWQTLNGEQAEEFISYREPGLGDLGRVQRQQQLLEALRSRLYSPTVLPKLPQLTRVMRRYLDTNLKIEEIMALVNFSLNSKRDNFQMTILPGIFSRLSADPNSYWLDLTGQVDLLTNYAGVTIAGMKPTIKPLPSLKIAVQNTSSEPQLTQKAVNYLKQKGFIHVYPVPDLPERQRHTQIVVEKGDPKVGEEIQKVLGLGNVEVSATGDLQSDITLQVGKDWK